MPMLEAIKGLNDTTFLLGTFRRVACLKSLLRSTEPGILSQFLVSAIDQKSPSTNIILKTLLSSHRWPWTDELWEIWSQQRQGWLAEILTTREQPCNCLDCKLGVLSHLRLHTGLLPKNAAIAEEVATLLCDPDEHVQQAALIYFQELKAENALLWAATLLKARQFKLIGTETAATDTVASLLTHLDKDLQKCARECFETWPFPVQLRAKLVAKEGSSLAITATIAYTISDFLRDTVQTVVSESETYIKRAISTDNNFAVHLAFKTGFISSIVPCVRTVTTALKLIHHMDKEVSSRANEWLNGLPNDRHLNDLIVNDWMDTDDATLYKLMKDGNRLPTEIDKEILLRLLWRDIEGYLAIADDEGLLLAKALAVTTMGYRIQIRHVVQESGDRNLIARYWHASVRLPDIIRDPAFAMLMATGDENLIVMASQDMTGQDLLVLCKRWQETGRRPSDAKSRETVDRAVSNYARLPQILVRPSDRLCSGLVDLVEVWTSDARPEDELQNELRSPDPVIRAGALVALNSRGVIRQEILCQKVRSADWPERLAAKLCGAQEDVSNDHVVYVRQCSGPDYGFYGGKVACSPEEFEVTYTQICKFRESKEPYAARAVVELEILQMFRELYRSMKNG